MTDGGEVSPTDVAEEAGRHPGSVRQALDRIPELVERECGSVSPRSKYVTHLIHDAVTEAKEGTRRAVEAGAKAIEVVERGVDKSASPFITRATKYDIDVQDQQGGLLRLDFGTVDDIRKKLREGFDL